MQHRQYLYLYSYLMHGLICLFWERRGLPRQVGWDSGLIDSPSLCRQLRDHRQSLWTGRSRTLYIRDCCWQGCFAPPDRDGRSPCLRGISCRPRCRAAFPPAELLWTAHHVSVQAQTEKRCLSITSCTTDTCSIHHVGGLTVTRPENEQWNGKSQWV